MPSWRRTYWAVFGANLITAVGMMSFLPFFPAILAELGVHDPSERMVWTGVIFGAAPLAAAFMGPIWGSIGDRHGRKPMVLRSMLAITLFVGLMAFASSPWELLALRLAQGLFSGFVPPSITLVSVVAPRETQGRVTGTLQAALPLGMISGPLVGDLVQRNFGMDGIFVFVSLASGTAALLVLFLASEEAPLRGTLARFSPTSLLSGAWDDLRQLLANRTLRSAIGLLFVVQFGMGATNPLLLILVEELEVGPTLRPETLTAFLFSAFALAGFVATPLWGRAGDRFGHRRALAVAAIVTAFLLGAHAAAATFAWLLAARTVLGAVMPGTNVAAFGVAATEIRDDRRGAAFGAVFSARAFAVSLGSMSGGALSAALGIRGLFLGVGALVLLWCVRSRRAQATTLRDPSSVESAS